MVLAHEFYCLADFCENEVDEYNAYCDTCMSYALHPPRCIECDDLLPIERDMEKECVNCKEYKRLEERIAYINEKLKTNMTPAQTTDWTRLLDKAIYNLSCVPQEYEFGIYERE